jgi:biotin transport system substrate-specific component
VSFSTLLDRTVAGSAATVPLRAAAVVAAAALTAAAAQFTTAVPFTAVPFTLTPIAVLVTGAALGSRLGALAQLSYLAAGIAGLAVFTPSLTLPPGALRLVGPTGGYLMAYPVAAFATGWLSERGWDRRYVTSLGALLAGLIVIYAGGVGWLAAAYAPSADAAVTLGLAPFLVLDVLKLTVAAMLLPRVWRLVGRRAPQSSTRSADPGH